MDYRAAIGRPQADTKPVASQPAPAVQYRKKAPSNAPSETNQHHGDHTHDSGAHHHHHEHRKTHQKSTEGNLVNPWSGPASSGSPTNSERSQRPGSNNKSKRRQKKVAEVVEEPKVNTFEKIKAMHQERNAALLERLNSLVGELDSSEEDDDFDLSSSGGHSASLKVSGNLSAFSGHSLSTSGPSLSSSTSSMLHQPEVARCTICLNRVKSDQAIWQCNKCYCDSFHLNCIKGWIKQNGVGFENGTSQTLTGSTGLPIENSSSGLSLSEVLSPTLNQSMSGVVVQQSAAMLKFRSTFWQCPNCRGAHELNRAPRDYYCYCGKVKDPEHDPWRAPHTCSQRCGRKLDSCEHLCAEPCHAGRCAPCAIQLDTSCHCGANSRVARCIDKIWSCGERCGTLLNCKRHRCALACHEGPCPPCADTFEIACDCGAETAVKPCVEKHWSCTKVCGQSLGCQGGHTCQKLCHPPGQCGPCPLTLELTCYCGKTTKAPNGNCKNAKQKFACEQTCSKSLSCGAHTCVRKCHEGECGGCSQISNRTCLCGKTKQKGPCAQSFRCTKTCDNVRNCGKHKCGIRCCAGSAANGAANRAVAAEGQDIAGCPPCAKICERKLDCGMCICRKPCHGDEPCEPCTQQRVNRCRCGFVTETVPCSPKRILTHLVLKSCIGGHKSEMVDCGTSPYLECKQKCGNLLSCGNCYCQRPCHEKTRLRTLLKEKKQVEIEVDGPCTDESCAQRSQIGSETHKHLERVTKVEKSVQEVQTSLAPLRRAKNGSIYTPQRHAHADLTLPVAEDGSQDSIYIPPNANDDTCDRCEKVCGIRYPTCEHMHRGACHLGDCPPCDHVLNMDCHCFAKRIAYPCHKLLLKKDDFDVSVKSCQKPCPYKLPCSHSCTKKCHFGKCTDVCLVKTRVTCKCKNLKQDLLCHEVLKLRTTLKVIDNSVLECEVECIQKKSSKDAKKDAERDAKLREKAAQLEHQIQQQQQAQATKRSKKPSKDVFAPVATSTPIVHPKASKWSFKLTQKDKTIIALVCVSLFGLFIIVLGIVERRKSNQSRIR